MTEYEMVTLLHPRLDEEGVTKMTEWVQGKIAELGGEVETVAPWGRRTLAYPILKQKEATYVQIDFKLDGPRVTELSRALRLHEDVLRHLPVKKSDRYRSRTTILQMALIASSFTHYPESFTVSHSS